MQELNLFLNLMEITHQLIEEGVTIDHAHDACLKMDTVFDDYEEHAGVPPSDVQLAFQDVFFTVKQMPEALKQYFQTVEGFHKENEIYLCELPPRFKAKTIHQVQLISGLFTILNTLISVGINSCHNHQARMEIHQLFYQFIKEEERHAECSSEIIEAKNQAVNEDLGQAQHLTRTLCDEKDDGLSAVLDYTETKKAQAFHTIIKETSLQNYFSQQIEDPTMAQSQLMSGLFNILHDLSEAGITKENKNQAYLKIDHLFQEVAQQLEEWLEDDNPDPLSNFFPNLEQQLDGLTLFPK